MNAVRTVLRAVIPFGPGGSPAMTGDQTSTVCGEPAVSQISLHGGARSPTSNCAWRGTALATALLALAATPAAAQDWDCSKADDLPQQGMNWCAYGDWQSADKALNALWPKVRKHMKSLDAESSEYFPEQANGDESLLKAQRAWIDYRDGQCEAEGAQFAGGSIRPLVTYSCLASMTRKRIEELNALMESR